MTTKQKFAREAGIVGRAIIPDTGEFFEIEEMAVVCEISRTAAGAEIIGADSLFWWSEIVDVINSFEESATPPMVGVPEVTGKQVVFCTVGASCCTALVR